MKSNDNSINFKNPNVDRERNPAKIDVLNVIIQLIYSPFTANKTTHLQPAKLHIKAQVKRTIC